MFCFVFQIEREIVMTSRFQINCTKCELFSIGVSKEDFLEIQQQIGFKLKKIPVRYLGVPLVTRRLTERDCEPLV